MIEVNNFQYVGSTLSDEITSDVKRSRKDYPSRQDISHLAKLNKYENTTHNVLRAKVNILKSHLLCFAGGYGSLLHFV